MSAEQTIRQFNQLAISHKLTGLAMQLWYTVYDHISQSRQDMPMTSAQLADTLHTSSRQLLRARTALIEAGCLQVHKQHGHTYYSIPLMQDSNSKDNSRNSRAAGSSTPQNKSAGNQPEQPRTYRPHIPKTPDIIMNRAYRELLPDAAAQLGIADLYKQRKMIRKLEHWCDMRRENGWTLTADGLTVSIANLRTHSAGDPDMMERIIDRTIRRCWKGFHPYIADAAPSGVHRQQPAKQQNRQTGRLPQYDTQKLSEEDFAFLEW